MEMCAKFSAMLGDLLLNCSMFRDASGEGWWHLLSRWILLPTNPRQPSSLLCQGDPYWLSALLRVPNDFILMGHESAQGNR